MLLSILAAAISIFATPQVCAQNLQIALRVPVGTGWHPWYEIQADHENTQNLIVCGSRWDGPRNALYGFVYASSDGGKTWRVALEDRSSTWVSETSCAFGPGHMAYFVSEASKVVDGSEHHDQGTTRVFVSTDGGQQWVEASRTAWADYSTSAVSEISGNLFTFYNNPGTDNADRNSGRTVGLLKFSPEGKTVSGPFFDPAMKERNYLAAFPSNAVSLRDGTVVALFIGARDTLSGREYDLGIERIGLSPSSSPTLKLIATSKKCLTLDDYSMVYDRGRERLLAVYSEDGGGACRMMLATSNDAGNTWRKEELLSGPRSSLNHVSLAQRPDGTLGLLWEDSGDWNFATFKDSRVVEPPLKIGSGGKSRGVSNDSLMTVIYGPGGTQPQDSGASISVGLNVRAMSGIIWRSSGLIAVGDKFCAISPAAVEGGEGLFLTALSPAGESARLASQPGLQDPADEDVTKQIVLLYGRAQSFNRATGVLTIDLRLGNRGDTPVRTPIRLEVNQISSRAGKVSVLNADNGLTGAGAIWDLSHIIVGSQIPTGSTTYNTFRLSFHIEITDGSIPTYNLLDLVLRVMASGPKVDDKKLSKPVP